MLSHHEAKDQVGHLSADLVLWGHIHIKLFNTKYVCSHVMIHRHSAGSGNPGICLTNTFARPHLFHTYQNYKIVGDEFCDIRD